MNILMLAYRFHPHVGGVEKHLLEVCRRLLGRGYTLTVITERYDPTLPEEEAINIGSNALNVIRLARDNCSPLRIIRKTFWRELVKKAALIRSADIVHCHDPGVFIYWYLPLRFLFLLKPTFVTFHGWDGNFPPKKRQLLLSKITETLTRGNICAGDFIGKWYGTKADYVTYGGVDSWGMVEDAVKGAGAVFVGRLAPDTGIESYLQSLSILKRKGTTLPLVVCGDGPLREQCSIFAREHGIEVEFKGWVNNPREYVLQSRYVFVSGYLAILEAMSLKRVVFAVYDNPLKEDYLKLIPSFNGSMFVAGSANELADQLERCIQNEQIEKKIVDSAFQYALQQTWDKVANAYEALWNTRN